MVNYLDFEKSLADVEGKIRQLNEQLLNEEEKTISLDEITKLETKAQDLLTEIYQDLGTWEKTQVARHPDRPHFKDYIQGMIKDFFPLAGDRVYGEDKAIIGGLGQLDDFSVMLIGHEKAQIPRQD
jgi:acetyl-CoA carboxylase carboxyl transferase subunit alpha